MSRPEAPASTPHTTSAPPGATSVPVTLLTSAACHLCEDAHAALEDLAHRYPLQLSVVALDSAEGQALQGQHRPPMTPLVLLDGSYFSAGRLPRRKLEKTLATRAAGGKH